MKEKEKEKGWECERFGGNETTTHYIPCRVSLLYDAAP
jgi:hypothetical protein